MEMRLDKMLAKYGLGSRKQVKNLIRKGFITVNGQIIKNDDYKVNLNEDEVVCDGEVINYQPYVYLMLNKPQGYVCATKDNVHPTVLDLIFGYENYELFPVGRLDLDTEGLLLITNDGDFAHRLMAPSRHHSKIYHARVDGILDENDVQLFKKGIVLDNGHHCLPANLKILQADQNSCEVEIEIFEGKFHQVKKMVAACNKEVVHLKRVAIKNLQLDRSLALGDFRELSQNELVDLMSDL